MPFPTRATVGAAPGRRITEPQQTRGLGRAGGHAQQAAQALGGDAGCVPHLHLDARSGCGLRSDPGQFRRRQIAGRPVDPVTGPPGGIHGHLGPPHRRFQIRRASGPGGDDHRHPVDPGAAPGAAAAVEAVGAESDAFEGGDDSVGVARRRGQGGGHLGGVAGLAGQRRARPPQPVRVHPVARADTERHHGRAIVGPYRQGLPGLSLEAALGQEVPGHRGAGAGGRGEIGVDGNPQHRRPGRNPPDQLETGCGHLLAFPTRLDSNDSPCSWQRASAHSRSDSRFRYGTTSDPSEAAPRAALGAPDDGAGHVEGGGERIVTGNHEIGERREPGADGIDLTLQGGDHVRRDQGDARLELGPVRGRGGQLRHQHVQVSLDTDENLVELRSWLGPRPGHAQGGLGLVDGAVGAR